MTSSASQPGTTRVVAPVVVPVLLATTALALLGYLTPVAASGVAGALVAVSVVTAWSAARHRDHEPQPSLVGVREALDTEMQRARRLDTALAVVRLAVDADHTLVADHLRATDIVVAGTKDVFVLMPGEDTAGAQQWLTRLQVRPVDFAAASFPADALTVDSLLEAVAPRPSPGRIAQRRRSA